MFKMTLKKDLVIFLNNKVTERISGFCCHLFQILWHSSFAQSFEAKGGFCD
jgi:hypothetical protein